MRTLAITAAAAALVSRPAALAALMIQFLPVVLVALIGLWAIGKIGLSWLVRGRYPRPAAPHRTTDKLCFRCLTSSGPRSVELLGYGDGIALGDDLSMIVVFRRGVLRPLLVRNLTTSTVMVRRGVATRVIILAVLILWITLRVHP